VLSLLALAVLLLAPALPVAQAQPALQGELLRNGNFETTSGATGSGQDSWLPWWAEITKPSADSLDYASKPTWNAQDTNVGAAPELVHSGSRSQAVINNWDPWWGGVKQVVVAPAGARVRLTAWGRAWAAAGHWPEPSDANVNSRMRVGIEPNGSEDQFAGSVVWSGTINPHGTWQAVSVEATVGASGRVLAILSGDYRGDSRLWMGSFWDDASLVVVSAPSNTAAPGNTAPPAPTSGGGGGANPPPANLSTSTPNADGSIVYVVQANDTLWGIAARHGVSVDQIRQLNGLTSDFISVGQRLIIAYVDGTPTPTPEGGAPTAEPTTDPAAATATPPATAIAQVTATPEGSGTVCALLWQDANGNGVRDSSEGLLPGGTLTVVDIATGAPVQAYTTDGLSEPHCFTELPPGQYTISSAPPAGYNPTTVSSTPLQIEAASTWNLEFGAQPSASAPEPTPAGGGRVLRTALLGAAGIVFLLLAAGGAAFIFLRRPR
jgi:LysM repeat protein